MDRTKANALLRDFLTGADGICSPAHSLSLRKREWPSHAHDVIETWPADHWIGVMHRGKFEAVAGIRDSKLDPRNDDGEGTEQFEIFVYDESTGAKRAATWFYDGPGCWEVCEQTLRE